MGLIVALAVGLLLLASALGLAVLSWITWMRKREPLYLACCLVAAAAGVVGLLASVSFPTFWWVTLVVAALAAWGYWTVALRSLGKIPARAARLWWISAVVLCSGAPALYVAHTAYDAARLTRELTTKLQQAEASLVTDELNRLLPAANRLVADPTLQLVLPAAGDASLTAALVRAAVIEQVPYLVVLDGEGKVIARTQPLGAAGEQWPLATPGDGTLQRNERGVPTVMLSTALQGSAEGTLVTGVPLTQSRLAALGQETSNAFFTLTEAGITSAAATDGKSLTVITSTATEELLLHPNWQRGSVWIRHEGSRYLVGTRTLSTASGRAVVALGSMVEDSSSQRRLLIDTASLLILVLLSIALTHRRTKPSS
jgi:hypothetical protein